MNNEILQQCTLYKNLNANELTYALNFFHAQERSFKKNEFLHMAGEPLPQFGLVLSGNIRVFMDDFDGNRMIMANVVPGITFGESLCYLKADPLVYIESVTDSAVLLMDTESLHNPAKVPTLMDLELTKRFTTMLAERTLSLNDRIQILSKLSIRQKVITLLSQFASQEGKASFTLPFGRETMATYLGVNQNALSRVLGQMEQENIIRFKGRSFQIL
mgnify:CR=1 FL=1